MQVDQKSHRKSNNADMLFLVELANDLFGLLPDPSQMQFTTFPLRRIQIHIQSDLTSPTSKYARSPPLQQ